MKIKFKDKVVELSNCCSCEVRNGILYNCNTGHDEGVEGDTVNYTYGGRPYFGCHVKGVTCYQFVNTEENGSVIISADEYESTHYHHNTNVELVEE